MKNSVENFKPVAQEDVFSAHASAAQEIFRSSVESLGASFQSYVPNADAPELETDVAILGRDDAAALVLSSGVHGLELLFGSAVQTAVLRSLAREPRVLDKVKFIFIHSINPFGAVHRRRFDEENIDLNRNFLTDDQLYKGAADGYQKLNQFINPGEAPDPHEPVLLKTLFFVMRYGFAHLKQAIGQGQYDFPDGLFFGGQRPSHAMQMMDAHFGSWIGASPVIAHLDFHTGLGKYATCSMLTDQTPASEDFRWMQRTYGADVVQSVSVPGSVAYQAEGSFGGWASAQFPDRKYRFAAAEFGTYGGIRMFRALRAERQAHFFAHPENDIFQSAKAEAQECFVPQDPVWRQTTLDLALGYVAKAAAALTQQAE